MDQPLFASHPAAGQAPEDSTKKRRHRWIWVVILLAFGLLFYWVITQHQKSQQAAMGGGGGRRGVMAGVAVPVVPATSKTGSLGIYLPAIGTVTPVYTDSITAQVTGVITRVHYREGQMVQKGDPLIDIDPRPYEAQLAQAQGALERDQNLLAEAQMDLERYQEAWAKNAIPRQTLEDQEKMVLQDQGTVKNDEGYGAVRPGAGELLPHHLADRRARGTAARGSRQPGDGELERRRWWWLTQIAADYGDLHAGRRQPGQSAGADARQASR